MLIHPKILAVALSDLTTRNHLMKKIAHLSGEDKKTYYQRVLNFWLGANTSLASIQKKIKYSALMPYIYIGHYCFLILDKQMSALDSSSTSFAMLDQCMQNMMDFYNKNYVLLKVNPHKLFLKFKSIINSIEVDLASQMPQQVIVCQAKQLCLNELNRAITKDFTNIEAPRPDTLQLSNTHLSRRTIFKRETLSIQIHKLITSSYWLFPFAAYTVDNNFSSQRIFVRAKDGTILDGVLVSNKQLPSKRIVLSLIGHFQSEHNYLSSSLIEFNKLFSSDIIFINHRNYSLRSYRSATNTHELAGDIVQFVEYFNQQQKQIILYGMCGGSAHMILAANTLREKNIHFKLIIDRFFNQYAECVDFKTLKRTYLYYLKNTVPPLFRTNATLLFYLFALILAPTARALSYLSSTNINFADKIRLIPENDLLVLQAKSKKRPGISEPEFTDIFVHPKNDIRGAIKDRRHHNKVILKKLSADCSQLTQLYSANFHTRKVFLLLSECFSNYVKLIDNEKLTSTPNVSMNSVTDLHAHKLYHLTTRNNLPMQQFLTGFFSKPALTCNATVAALPAYSAQEIFAGLHYLDPHLENLAEISGILSDFLNDIKKHENFICHVGNRLFATDLGDINFLLLELIDSVLFRSIAQNPMMQESKRKAALIEHKAQAPIPYPKKASAPSRVGTFGKIATGAGFIAGAATGGVPAAILYGLWGLAGGTVADKLSDTCRRHRPSLS